MKGMKTRATKTAERLSEHHGVPIRSSLNSWKDGKDIGKRKKRRK